MVGNRGKPYEVQAQEKDTVVVHRQERCSVRQTERKEVLVLESACALAKHTMLCRKDMA